MSWNGTCRILRTRNDGKRDSAKLTGLFNKRLGGLGEYGIR